MDTVQTNLHTLLSREIRPIQNWNKWKQCWQRATTLEEMLGLLHVGFKVKLPGGEYKASKIERLKFYFELANGWNDIRILEQQGEHSKEFEFGCDRSGNLIYLSRAQVRQKLAEKAFLQLADNFFPINLTVHSKNGNELFIAWEQFMISEGFLLIIKDFFRIETEQYGNKKIVQNLSKNAAAQAFLANLAHFMWCMEAPRNHMGEHLGMQLGPLYVTEEERQPIINAVKPFQAWMIEILVRSDEWEFLKRIMLILDQPCVDKITEIAMSTMLVSNDFNWPGVRVNSIDQACLAGSKAAWFLKERALILEQTKALEQGRLPL